MTEGKLQDTKPEEHPGKRDLEAIMAGRDIHPLAAICYLAQRVEEIERQLADRSTRFSPPTVEDVERYAKTIKWQRPFSAQEFMDYYESRGWMMGKNKMKSWRAAVRYWNKPREGFVLQQKQTRIPDNLL